MSEKFKKIQVAKITVFITSIFVIFLSVTYALVGQVLTGNKRQVVTAGDIRIRLDEENEITLNNAMPVYDEVGMIGTPFKFQVVNEGSSKANYILKLIDITTGDESTKLSSSLVRYGLTKDGVTTIKNLSSAFSDSIDKGSISGNQTINYELRLWIDFKVEDESLIKDKTIKYKIGIEVEPPKQYAKYDAMMRKRSTSSSTDYFWKYSKQITSIVFEPNINIPEGAESWDVSATANSGQVMAYVEKDGKCTVRVYNSETKQWEDNEVVAYKLHIQAKNGVAANTNCSSLFSAFINLTTIDGLEYLDTSNVTNMDSMFSDCDSLTNFNLSNFDTSKVTDMDSMFFSCDNLVSLKLTDFDTSNVVTMRYMFRNCLNLTDLDISDFDTSKVTNMEYMFCTCGNLVNLSVSHFDTSKVKTMQSMFSGCSSLTGLDVSNFDTLNVNTMEGMFTGCSSLTSLDLSHFNTSNVTNMGTMFQACLNLVSLDLSNFDTSSVASMFMMFNGCKSLKEIGLSSFNTSSVENMSYMFNGCNNLAVLDVSHFITSSVTNMSHMFDSCTSLTGLDLSHFDVSKVTSMSDMFYYCTNLKDLNLDGFTTSKVTNMDRMFYGCSSLATLDLSSFDVSNVNSTTSMLENFPRNLLIVVKDEAMKTWVLEVSRYLTNVQVKSA